MNLLKKILQPKTCSSPLVRLGRLGDGGYIIDQNSLNSITRCYTYGVSDEISFEYGLFEKNSNTLIHLYDHTIDEPKPKLPSRMIFHKEGLSGGPNQNMDSFFNHLIKNQETEPLSNILLKMDAERGEYDLFNNNDFSKFQNLRSMIIEFHDLIERLENFSFIIDKLNQYFDIIHIHGNNCGRRFNFNGFIFPDIPEITFLNKQFNSNSSPISKMYPIEKLDYPNNDQSNTDFSIDFL